MKGKCPCCGSQINIPKAKLIGRDDHGNAIYSIAGHPGMWNLFWTQEKTLAIVDFSMRSFYRYEEFEKLVSDAMKGGDATDS